MKFVFVVLSHDEANESVDVESVLYVDLESIKEADNLRQRLDEEYFSVYDGGDCYRSVQYMTGEPIVRDDAESLLAYVERHVSEIWGLTDHSSS